MHAFITRGGGALLFTVNQDNVAGISNDNTFDAYTNTA